MSEHVRPVSRIEASFPKELIVTGTLQMTIFGVILIIILIFCLLIFFISFFLNFCRTQ